MVWKRMVILMNYKKPIKDIIPHSKPYISENDKKYILNVMNSGMISSGEKVKEFEQQVSKYIGVKNGIATSSGTMSVVFSLKALDIKKGDEVIIPTYLCPCILEAVLAVEATPVLCDVDTEWILSKKTVEPHITTNTKAIIVPHICGISVKIEDLLEFGIPIIEDIAQAFGGMLNNRKIGTYGDFTVCSFGAIKCLTTGEGGMVLTNNDEMCEKIRKFKVFSPMSDIQAMLGISQLKMYDFFLERRKKIANMYLKEFSIFEGLCMSDDLKNRDMFFRFPLNLNFNEVKDVFLKKNVIVRQFIDFLLHRILKLDSKNYPNAEYFFKNTISIPIYPALTDYEVEYIIDTTKSIINEIKLYN
ncbi:hypothetical protein DP127_05650 [Clostridium tetani]|nr:hypothetical protein DP127_05650 [Clostridium tetani]